MNGTQESKVCEAWYVQPIGQSYWMSWQSALLEMTVNHLECENTNHLEPERSDRAVEVRWAGELPDASLTKPVPQE